MKTFAVVGKNKKKVAALVKNMQKLGFKLDRKRPDFIVSYGGDGTFLHSERLYPGITKLLSRENSICQKCNNMLLGAVLERIGKGKFRIWKFNKLEATVGRKRHLATNDIIIRNSFPGHAVRFTVSVNNRKIGDVLIGDGVVISSVFGATGYFHSITGGGFKKGIGIAFNNLVEKVRHKVVDNKSSITVKIVRGNAQLVSDNNPDVTHISKNSWCEYK